MIGHVIGHAICLVDFGLGNLRSVGNALAAAGARDVVTTSDPDLVRRADRLVVPGQGGFADCSRALVGTPLGDALVENVRRGTPYLGICLGLQILFQSSEEAPGAPGLALLPGRVVRLRDRATDGTPLKIPHMGWNAVAPSRPHPLLPTAPTPFYFVHSYHALPDEPRDLLATCDYGGQAVTAAVARDNLFAVQFHPEKSQRAGIELLARFLAA